jgi:signal transduction histidine kinase
VDEPTGWSYVKDAAHPAWCLDADLRYRCVNAAWQAGARARTVPSDGAPPDVVGRSYLDELHPRARERWAGPLREIVAGRLGHFADEAIDATPAGEQRTVRTASPTLGPDGRPDGVLLVCYDVTDAATAARNAELNARSIEAARRLQHFLGNQLALTMGYVELLTIDPRLPEELRDRVEEALRGVVEATETLNRLRLLARQEAGPDDPAIVEYLRGEGR